MFTFRRPTVDVTNTPDPLVFMCVRKIILENIDFSMVPLPQELCDLLMQVYREEFHSGSVSAADCDKFISQFTTPENHKRLTHCDLSGLPVTDLDVANIFYQHSKHITTIDISNCPNLTYNTLDHYNESLSKVIDINKICRTISLAKTTNNRLESNELLVHRVYDQLKWGIISQPINQSENSPDVVSTDDIDELYEQASLHEDTALEQFYTQFKAAENNTIPGTYTGGETLDDKVDCGDGTYICFKHTQRWRLSKSEKQLILEVRSWQVSPLTSLILGDSRSLIEANMDENTLYDRFLAHCCNLKKLVTTHWPYDLTKLSLLTSSYLSYNLQYKLEYLDLSRCSSIGSGVIFLNLKNLKTLILYNVPKLDAALISISKLRTLHYLDISASNDHYGHGYKHPEDQLQLLSLGLPNLTHLDISGTNLAGPRCEHIRGLSNRYSRPFEFLGLYNTSNEAAYRPNIPAIKIAGDATEEQILTACEAYYDRVDLLKKTLNDLFQCFRFENNFKDLNRALDIVLVAMSRHLNEKQIQITASASLFYIVKSEDARCPFNPKIRRMIIKTLLDAMHTHRQDITMLRNGSLTLVHFKIPQDVLFEYARLVDILLYIVTDDEDEFVQRLGVYLLNTLACQVDGEQKLLVGDLGAISKMLDLIRIRLERGQCDEVMETAWSTMWNVTDETPVNCQRFLDNGGMDYFMKCVSVFPTQPELLRNMMGLLGNVAECPNLRHRLMVKEYINCFTEMLFSESDGIEISYNAAGILSHIASDGEEAWLKHLPNVDRSFVLKQMRLAISKWKINSKRNINYRSFEPILRLISPNVTNDEAQYWAVFALVNLTRVHSSKYCQLLMDDGGVEILQNLLERPKLPDYIAKYAKLTLYQVKKYNEEKSLGELEDSEQMDLE